MATKSATGTVSWPGAVYNGQTFTINVTYNWTSNTSCSVSVSFSGGCGGSAGSDGAAYQQNYPGWAVGTCKVDGSNKITGMYIYYRVQSYPGAGYTNYTWSGTVNKSSSFTVNYNYSHTYGGGTTVTCSMSTTIPYSPPSYTISYNANGHGTAPASQNKTHGTTLTLRPFISNITDAAVSGTITGNANGGSWSGSNGLAQWATTYSQTYWNTNNSGTGTNYGSGADYTTNAAATFYAIWSSSTAGTSYSLPTGTPTKASTTTTIGTVTVNANGGTLSGYTNNQSSTRTTTYSFKGWFTATSGGTQRTSSSRVTAAETVYAQYDSSTSAQTSVVLPTAAQCTKSGAILSGFSTSASDLYPLYDPGSAFTPTANITLYAIWIVVEVIASTYNGKPSGFLTVKGNSNYQKYLPYIRVGSSWQIAIPYVYYNGHWVIAGQTGEIIT